MAKVICTIPILVPRSLAILENPGKYISMANGPNADIAPKVHASFRADAAEGMFFDGSTGAFTGKEMSFDRGM